jgi:3-hydroxyanthranilate 3,4-dioxygenase
MVIERRRTEHEHDHLRWYCEGCGEVLHDSEFPLIDLGKQLKPIIENFYADESLRTCEKCGAVMEVPAQAK